MGFQTGQIGVVRCEAAAGGDDGLLPLGEFLHKAAFPFAEGRLAVLRKNVGNGLAGAGFNGVVGVEKGKVERGRQHLADRGFAGAHEADEGDVLNLARVIHGIQLNHPRPVGTPFLRVNSGTGVPPVSF